MGINDKVDPDFVPLRWLNRIPGYQYYDTPDGQDCLKKVLYMNKLGLLFGGFYSTIDVITMSKPVGIANIALRYATITLPGMAIGSTFAAVTCLATNIREKDDFWNYGYGGFAAGAVAGAAAKSGTFGTLCAVSFGAFGMIKKYCLQQGWILSPYSPAPPDAYHLRGLWSNKWDFSLTKDDQPKGWKAADS